MWHLVNFYWRSSLFFDSVRLGCKQSVGPTMAKMIILSLFYAFCGNFWIETHIWSLFFYKIFSKHYFYFIWSLNVISLNGTSSAFIACCLYYCLLYLSHFVFCPIAILSSLAFIWLSFFVLFFLFVIGSHNMWTSLGLLYALNFK